MEQMRLGLPCSTGHGGFSRGRVLAPDPIALSVSTSIVLVEHWLSGVCTCSLFPVVQIVPGNQASSVPYHPSLEHAGECSSPRMKSPVTKTDL
jgi:hypothetical protein